MSPTLAYLETELAMRVNRLTDELQHGKCPNTIKFLEHRIDKLKGMIYANQPSHPRTVRMANGA